jgi:adenosylmethionine-8-amino-7-oxononanoate aminotransferase
VALELEEKIIELGAQRVAAFVAETVVGATAGAVTAVPGYFRRIREICDQYGIHLILDEVMCGSGRTGSMMAYQQEQVIPDIVTMAKGLAAGYQPIGALLCQPHITETLRQNSGYFQHGHTFMGHATSVAAALATLKVIRDEDLLDNVVARGEAIRAALRKNLSTNEHVGDIRGRGLFIGVEFVLDQASKAPFDPEMKLHKRVQKAAMERGLLCYGMGGTIDGRRGDHILLAPPYNLKAAEQQELIERFSAAVLAALPATPV